MIPGIRNALQRRTLLVLTVAMIIVALGPAAMIRSAALGALNWIEREFDIDLKQAWNGTNEQ